MSVLRSKSLQKKRQKEEFRVFYENKVLELREHVISYILKRMQSSEKSFYNEFTRIIKKLYFYTLKIVNELKKEDKNKNIDINSLLERVFEYLNMDATLYVVNQKKRDRYVKLLQDVIMEVHKGLKKIFKEVDDEFRKRKIDDDLLKTDCYFEILNLSSVVLTWSIKTSIKQ